MGHALNASTQDVLIRCKACRGFNVLWQPGYDHASISVHAVIDRQLLAEGTNRFELGREAFVERTWVARGVRRDHHGAVAEARSLDYSRERFTMDDAYIRAVYRFFVHLPSGVGSTRTTGSSTGARAAGRPCRISRCRIATSTTHCRRFGTRSPTGRGGSRSRPCGRRRSSATSRSRHTRRTSGTASSCARRRSFRMSSGGCRSWPTRAWILRSEPGAQDHTGP